MILGNVKTCENALKEEIITQLKDGKRRGEHARVQTKNMFTVFLHIKALIRGCG